MYLIAARNSKYEWTTNYKYISNTELSVVLYFFWGRTFVFHGKANIWLALAETLFMENYIILRLFLSLRNINNTCNHLLVNNTLNQYSKLFNKQLLALSNIFSLNTQLVAIMSLTDYWFLLDQFSMLCNHRLVCQVEKRGGEYKESARGREDLQHTERRPATYRQLSILLLVLSWYQYQMILMRKVFS